jgi:ACS family hexuronate transporter-like MFS transporter
MRTTKIPHLRWYIAALLFTASVINYVDRQTLSLAAPVLTREMHITPVEYSTILQAFLIAYTLMYVGSGILVDRWGTRRAFSLFVAWWSASNMIHAAARSALQFSACRFMLGTGESGSFIASFKAISEWYPAKEKALVNGLVNAGAAVGAIIAAPLITLIVVWFGWRPAFIITGALGYVWLVPWLYFYYSPERHPRITECELNYLRASIGEPSLAARNVRYRHLLAWPQTWGLLLSRLVSDPVWWFYLFWLPKYLVEQRGFTLVQMGLLAWLPYLASDLGAIGGGMFSGWLVKRGWNALQARSAVMLPCALVMPLSAVIGLTLSPASALSIMCLVAFAHMGWKTCLMTVNNDIYPSAIVGSVSGIIAFGSGLGAVLFTNLTGHLVQNYSYSIVFVLMGFLHPTAYLIFRLMVKGPVILRQVIHADEAS